MILFLLGILLSRVLVPDRHQHALVRRIVDQGIDTHQQAHPMSVHPRVEFLSDTG